MKILLYDFNGLYDFCKIRLSTPFAASRIMLVLFFVGVWVATGLTRENSGVGTGLAPGARLGHSAPRFRLSTYSEPTAFGHRASWAG